MLAETPVYGNPHVLLGVGPRVLGFWALPWLRALVDDLGLPFTDHEIQEMLDDDGDLCLRGVVQVSYWQHRPGTA